MTIAPGARLGSYEVVAPIGAGGMGEVYRARDPKLRRDVAIKILPDALARDADRLARFVREGRTLAALSHPNIAAIYGVEDTAAGHALVMELVDGPTLADRLAQGALPLDEAVALARQIAAAVDAAHEQGIVHRDLKPSNVKVRADGAVKVLDFGLAKALASDPASAAADAGSLSPTVTTPAMTRAGVILGTAAYMSPEQARGLPVDRGADIWAFGCLVFEMLTGTRAFAGDNVADTLAAILRQEPDWSRLPDETPAAIRRLLRRCLQKARPQRLADIRDARLELDETDTEPRPGPEHAAPPAMIRERGLWTAALLASLVLAGVLAWQGQAVPAGPGQHVSDIATPATSDPFSLALSPDGRYVAYVASDNGLQRLWVRSLESGEARVLPGTDEAAFPFWKPDSRSIGFFAGEKLQRIDLDGGAPRVLAFAPVGAGGSWSREDVVLYTPTPDAPVFRVPAGGGEFEIVPGGAMDDRGGGNRFPVFLPDGRHFLYYHAESRGVFLGRLDSPERRRLFDADAAAVFAFPDDVLFVRGGRLFAQRFDTAGPAPVGDPDVVAEGIAIERHTMVAAVSASAVGSLVFRAGSGERPRQFAWFDRDGTVLETVGGPDSAYPINPTLSPDETQVAFNRSVEGDTGIWLMDLRRQAQRLITFDPGPEIVPLWSYLGDRILFAAAQGFGGFRLVVKPADERGGEAVAVAMPPTAIPLDWTRDGLILFRHRDAETGWDIWAKPGEGEAFPVVRTRAEERSAKLSPDGGWLAYESDESGSFDVYVQSFPDGRDQAVVSAGGGSQPRWSRDGSEIFYVSADGWLMTVPVRHTSGGASPWGTPERLFRIPAESAVHGGIAHTYDVSGDGRRFLISTLPEVVPPPMTLVLNRRPHQIANVRR